MEKTLPCGYELGFGDESKRLKRLFGLLFGDRRRSSFSPVSEDLGGVDLSPITDERAASLR